jgi:CubicO group peptidase (beta-lactamase class C family)
MMKYLHTLFLIFLCQGLLTKLYAQDKKYAPEIELKIKAVENNLGFWIQVEGDPNLTLKDRMNFYHVKGVSIAVIKDYKIEWVRGYGWADSVEQRSVTTGTLFQAGSISKSMNAVGVLKMVQDKRLDLYVDINDYLRTWKFPYDSLSKSKKVTLANLLSHTAGLSIHGFPGYEKGDTIPTLVQILNGEKPANTAAVRSEFEPGLRGQYSGGGTTISQLILQEVAKKPYDVFMWENVLKPMGMKNSFYTQPPPASKQKLLASGYYADGKEVKEKYHIYPEQAAAGLWTNPTDLAHYIIETQLALQGKSNKVLSQEMTKLRLTPYIDKSAALGVFIYKKGENTYFHHSGSDEGFTSQYYGSMEGGNGVVVMANSDRGSITDEIVNSVATVYGWKGFYSPLQRPKIISVPQNILESYVGEYMLKAEDKFYIKISLVNGRLVYSEPNWAGFELYAGAENDFFSRVNPVGITFIKDTAGKVIELEYHRGSRNDKFKKIK